MILKFCIDWVTSCNEVHAKLLLFERKNCFAIAAITETCDCIQKVTELLGEEFGKPRYWSSEGVHLVFLSRRVTVVHIGPRQGKSFFVFWDFVHLRSWRIDSDNITIHCIAELLISFCVCLCIDSCNHARLFTLVVWCTAWGVSALMLLFHLLDFSRRVVSTCALRSKIWRRLNPVNAWCRSAGRFLFLGGPTEIRWVGQIQWKKSALTSGFGAVIIGPTGDHPSVKWPALNMIAKSTLKNCCSRCSF